MIFFHSFDVQRAKTQLQKLSVVFFICSHLATAAGLGSGWQTQLDVFRHRHEWLHRWSRDRDIHLTSQNGSGSEIETVQWNIKSGIRKYNP